MKLNNFLQCPALLKQPPGQKSKLSIGTVLCVNYADQRVCQSKNHWYPAIVTGLNLACDNDDQQQIKVKSFVDDSVCLISQNDASIFNKTQIEATYHHYKYCSELRSAIDKALRYLNTGIYPDTWCHFNSFEVDDDSDDDDDYSSSSSEYWDE